MIMTIYGRAIHESIATSAGVGVMVSIPGLSNTWWLVGIGFVSIAAVLALMRTSFLAAKLGERVAHRVSKQPRELCFAIETYIKTRNLRLD
jgi:uncharacterized membrane protein YfcA